MIRAALPDIREQPLCRRVAEAWLPIQIRFYDRIGVEPGKSGKIDDFFAGLLQFGDVGRDAGQQTQALLCVEEADTRFLKNDETSVGPHHPVCRGVGGGVRSQRPHQPDESFAVLGMDTPEEILTRVVDGLRPAQAEQWCAVLRARDLVGGRLPLEGKRAADLQRLADAQLAFAQFLLDQLVLRDVPDDQVRPLGPGATAFGHQGFYRKFIPVFSAQRD